MTRYIIPPKKDDDKPRRRYIIPPRRKSDDDRLDDERRVNSSDVKQTGNVKSGKSDDKVRESEFPVNSGGIPQNVSNVSQNGGSVMTNATQKSVAKGFTKNSQQTEKIEQTRTKFSESEDEHDRSSTQEVREDRKSTSLREYPLRHIFVSQSESVMTNATQATQSGVSHPNRPESDFIEDESSEVGSTEGDVAVTDDRIIIRGKNRSTLEVEARLVGYVDDYKRLKDMKIPRLPKFVLEAKKKDGQVLRLEAVVDYVETSEGTKYFIRNKREVIDKLYEFRANRHISKALINDALDAWLSKIEPESMIKWVDVLEVVKDYPEWEEINRDPVGFFLRRATTVVGNEKVKLATLLAVVSSQLVRLEEGIYRIHLILNGKKGAGKSSTIRSITRLFFEHGEAADFIIWRISRLTQNALGYAPIGDFDGHVVYIEQLDNVEGVRYLREAMSEGRISTLVTEKDPETGELRAVEKVIEGQPSFVATNVTAKIDDQILSRAFQLYLSQTDDQTLRKILEHIVFRRPPNNDDLLRLKLVTYAWLKTRPKDPIVTREIGERLIDILTTITIKDNIKRATEIARNLVRAVASMFGHDKVEASDLEFALKYFKKDILLTTLELDERDLDVLKWFRDHGYVWSDERTSEVPTSEVAVSFGMSTNDMKKLLDRLYDRGLLTKRYDGKRFFWSLSEYGLRVVEVLEEKLSDDSVVELRDEKGEVVGLAEGSFRPPDDSRGDRRDDVRGSDGDRVQDDEGEAQGVGGKLLEAYEWLKKHGPALLTDVEFLFGAEVIEALKKKDLVTFNVLDGVEYVFAK